VLNPAVERQGVKERVHIGEFLCSLRNEIAASDSS
jgi:hypothetical protein